MESSEFIDVRFANVGILLVESRNKNMACTLREVIINAKLEAVREARNFAENHAGQTAWAEAFMQSLHEQGFVVSVPAELFHDE